MVSSQTQSCSPIPGEGDWGNIRAMEEMKLPVATLHKRSHNFTSEQSVPTLSQCWIPITAASQHSRQELLSRRQNNICLNCQRFTELVTQQAAVQGEMAFQSEDLPVAGTRLGRERTRTLPRKWQGQEGHVCRHQALLFHGYAAKSLWMLQRGVSCKYQTQT